MKQSPAAPRSSRSVSGARSGGSRQAPSRSARCPAGVDSARARGRLFVFARHQIFDSLFSASALTSFFLLDVVILLYRLWAIVDAYLLFSPARARARFEPKCRSRSCSGCQASLSAVVLGAVIVATVGTHLALGAVDVQYRDALSSIFNPDAPSWFGGNGDLPRARPRPRSRISRARLTLPVLRRAVRPARRPPPPRRPRTRPVRPRRCRRPAPQPGMASRSSESGLQRPECLSSEWRRRQAQRAASSEPMPARVAGACGRTR